MLTREVYNDLFRKALDSCAPIKKNNQDNPNLPSRRKFDISAPDNIKNPLFYTYFNKYLKNGNTIIPQEALMKNVWFDGTPPNEIALGLSCVDGATAIVKVVVSNKNSKKREMIEFKVSN